MRQAQILILEILNVFLRLKFSPSLILNKLKRFETGSNDKFYLIYNLFPRSNQGQGFFWIPANAKMRVWSIRYFNEIVRVEGLVKSNTDGARRKCPWGAK